MPAAAATARAHPTHAAQTEQWLLPAEAGFLEAEGMERTYRFSQEALASSADATSARKAFDLSLPELGPYCLDYTPNGRHVLLGGRKGHLAVVDWAKPRLTTEIQVCSHHALQRSRLRSLLGTRRLPSRAGARKGSRRQVLAQHQLLRCGARQVRRARQSAPPSRY